jgi:hypothetical protein
MSGSYRSSTYPIPEIDRCLNHPVHLGMTGVCCGIVHTVLCVRQRILLNARLNPEFPETGL